MVLAPTGAAGNNMEYALELIGLALLAGQIIGLRYYVKRTEVM